MNDSLFPLKPYFKTKQKEVEFAVKLHAYHDCIYNKIKKSDRA